MPTNHVTHNMSKTRIYQTWLSMKSRCNNSHNNRYYCYGNRGISYDPQWDKFENFYKDMKNGYKNNLTLDRIDTNKNYSKENCKWSTLEEQMNNKTTNQVITYNGKTQTIVQWAREMGINKFTLYNRLSRNVPIEKLLLKNIRHLRIYSKRKGEEIETLRSVGISF